MGQSGPMRSPDEQPRQLVAVHKWLVRQKMLLKKTPTGLTEHRRGWSGAYLKSLAGGWGRIPDPSLAAPPFELPSPNSILSAPSSIPSPGAALFKFCPWESSPKVSLSLGLLKTISTVCIRPDSQICHVIPRPPSWGSYRTALLRVNLDLLILFNYISSGRFPIIRDLKLISVSLDQSLL